MGARPHSESTQNNGGVPSSCGRFGDFLLFFIAAKSWWFLDPLAVIQLYKRNWNTFADFFTNWGVSLFLFIYHLWVIRECVTVIMFMCSGSALILAHSLLSLHESSIPWNKKYNCTSHFRVRHNLRYSLIHCKAKYQKFETNVPRKGIARPLSQFPHSCVCLDINRLQTHECGKRDWGFAILFLGIHKRDFRCSVLCTHPYLWHFDTCYQDPLHG